MMGGFAFAFLLLELMPVWIAVIVATILYLRDFRGQGKWAYAAAIATMALVHASFVLLDASMWSKMFYATPMRALGAPHVSLPSIMECLLSAGLFAVSPLLTTVFVLVAPLIRAGMKALQI